MSTRPLLASDDSDERRSPELQWFDNYSCSSDDDDNDKPRRNVPQMQWLQPEEHSEHCAGNDPEEVPRMHVEERVGHSGHTIRARRLHDTATMHVGPVDSVPDYTRLRPVPQQRFVDNDECAKVPLRDDGRKKRRGRRAARKQQSMTLALIACVCVLIVTGTVLLNIFVAPPGEESTGACCSAFIVADNQSCVDSITAEECERDFLGQFQGVDSECSMIECPPTNATRAPTSEPTVAPTAAPTTIAPTAQPTRAPTVSPSMAPAPPPPLPPTAITPPPTIAPTNEPTRSPSTAPTSAPSRSPTTQPTPAGTRQPSVSPTQNPTASPSSSPTRNPTASPTTTPTDEPTTAPSMSPTAAPTTSPSVSPTVQPTAAPINGTEAPTSSPTHSPTAMPTLPPGVGACCFIETCDVMPVPINCTEGAQCTEMDGKQCYRRGGIFNGEGRLCDDPDVCVGSCCLFSGCLNSTRYEECQDGIFMGLNTFCESEEPCEMACCETDGRCVDSTFTRIRRCINGNGRFHGFDVTCDDIGDCSVQENGCCRAEDTGACRNFLSRDVCESEFFSSSNTTFVPNLQCDTNDCECKVPCDCQADYAFNFTIIEEQCQVSGTVGFNETEFDVLSLVFGVTITGTTLDALNCAPPSLQFEVNFFKESIVLPDSSTFDVTEGGIFSGASSYRLTTNLAPIESVNDTLQQQITLEVLSEDLPFVPVEIGGQQFGAEILLTARFSDVTGESCLEENAQYAVVNERCDNSTNCNCNQIFLDQRIVDIPCQNESESQQSIEFTCEDFRDVACPPLEAVLVYEMIEPNNDVLLLSTEVENFINGSLVTIDQEFANFTRVTHEFTTLPLGAQPIGRYITTLDGAGPGVHEFMVRKTISGCSDVLEDDFIRLNYPACPTAAPTREPTPSPTVPVVPQPTAQPTVSPTRQPTAAPTESMPPTGACCSAELSFEGCADDRSERECAAAKGFYLGNGTVCDSDEAQQCSGACCFSDSCDESLNIAACQESDGVFLGVQSVCPNGVGQSCQLACCFPNAQAPEQPLCFEDSQGIAFRSCALSSQTVLVGANTACSEVDCAELLLRSCCMVADAPPVCRGDIGEQLCTSAYTLNDETVFVTNSTCNVQTNRCA